MALDGVTKHPNLWFDDGNIILVAENVGFCVYQGMITKQSEVFRDRLTKKPMSLFLGLLRVMFELPQPSTVDSNFGGRRVVYLNDDGADEVATVLDLLFDARHSFYKNTEQIPFLTAAAALRLGTKYGFKEMREEALRRISACYPKDLQNLHTGANDCDDPGRCPIAWKEGDCIAVLHLARQLGLDDLVPAALYRCANDVSIEQLFTAATTRTGVHSLTFQELQDCMQSRRELLAVNIKLYDMFSQMVPACVRAPQGPTADGGPDDTEGRLQESKCRQRMKDILVWAHRDGSFDASLALFPMDAWIDYNVEPDALCSICGSNLKSTHAGQREEIWAGLRNKYCTNVVKFEEQDGEGTVKWDETVTSLKLDIPERPTVNREFSIARPRLRRMHESTQTSLSLGNAVFMLLLAVLSALGTSIGRTVRGV